MFRRRLFVRNYGVENECLLFEGGNWLVMKLNLYLNSECSCLLKEKKQTVCCLPATSICVSFGILFCEAVCVCWTWQNPSLTELKAGRLTKQHRGPPQANSHPMRQPRQKYERGNNGVTSPPPPPPPPCHSLVTLPNNDGYFSGCSPPRCSNLPNKSFSEEGNRRRSYSL